MEKQQKILIDRVNQLCKEKNISYYTLAYDSAVPLSTLLHIMDGSTKNPGIFTIAKICDGLGVSLAEFFSTYEFTTIGIKYF